MNTCPTVKIKAKNETGYLIINESDFDKKVDTLFEEAPAPKADKTAKIEPPVDLDPVEVARRSAIDIPADWEKLAFMTARGIARDISRGLENSKDDVAKTILGELARRSEIAPPAAA